MMLLFGILVLIGTGTDIAFRGFSGLHMLLLACGLLLVLINVLGGKLFPKIGGIIGKGVLSLAVLTITVLFLAGFFSADTLTDVNDERTLIIKAERILEKDGAEKAAKWLETESAKLTEWSRDVKYELAQLYAGAGDSQKAMSGYEEIFYHDGYDIPARYAYAGVLFELKDYGRAIDQLLYILRLQPEHPDACMLLGDCYWALDDSLRGIYYYRLAVDLQPGSIEKRVKLAQAYANTHSWEESEAEYRKAMELASGFEEEMLVYNGYTKIQQTEQQTEAEGTIDEAGTTQDPGNQ